MWKYEETCNFRFFAWPQIVMAWFQYFNLYYGIYRSLLYVFEKKIVVWLEPYLNNFQKCFDIGLGFWVIYIICFITHYIWLNLSAWSSCTIWDQHVFSRPNVSKPSFLTFWSVWGKKFALQTIVTSAKKWKHNTIQQKIVLDILFVVDRNLTWKIWILCV